MAATVLGSAITGAGDSRRAFGRSGDSDTTRHHVYGDNLAVWDCSDPTNILLKSTTSISGLLVFNNRTFCTLAVTASSVTAWSDTVPPDGPFIPSTGAPQTVSISATGNQRAVLADSSPTIFIVSDGNDASLIQCITEASHPKLYVKGPSSVSLGDQVSGLASNVADDTIGSLAGQLWAAGGTTFTQWTYSDDGSGALTFNPDWTATTDGTDARNVHADLVFLVLVGLITSSGLELYNMADGSLAGIYVNGAGGNIVDFAFSFGSCIFVITDDTANHFHTVDISTPSAPVLIGTETLLAGHKLATIEGQGTSFVLTGNDGGTNEASIIVIEADCSVPTPSASSFASCFSLGSFLFVADTDGSALKIYDLTDPTTPALTATLDLASPPTDVVLLDTMAYLIAGDTIYGVNIDDIAGPVQVIEKEDVAGEFLVNASGLLWASGDTMGLRALSVVPGEDDLTIEQYLPPPATGASRVAFTRDRLIFADVPASSTARLRTYKFGGFKCHNVSAGHVGVYEADSETLRARIGDIRHLSANSVDIRGSPGGGFDGYVKLGDKYIVACIGSPEGVVTAPPGSLALSDSGAAYRKSSGSGNTGWTTI